MDKRLQNSHSSGEDNSLRSRFKLKGPARLTVDSVAPSSVKNVNSFRSVQQKLDPKTRVITKLNNPRYISDFRTPATPKHLQLRPKSGLIEIVQNQNTLNAAISKPKARSLKTKKHFEWKGWLLPSLTALLLIVGVLVTVATILTNKNSTTQVHALTQSQNTSSSKSEPPVEIPDETPPSPSDVKNYTVDPNLPRYLDIKSIGVHSRILKTGLKSSGEVKVPSSIFNVGWLNISSNPKDAGGAALMVGHVSGPTSNGVFKKLNTLKSNDKIEVVMGDNKRVAYRVVGTEQVDAKNLDMSKYLVSKIPGKAGLNLMTCGGEFNPKNFTFKQRFVVFAVRD